MRATTGITRLLMTTPQCHLYSTLMALSCFGRIISPKQAVVLIGHDGMKVRGFHRDEILDLLALFGFGFVEYERYPVCMTLKENSVAVLRDSMADARFEMLLQGNVGMLTTETHVVCWDGSHVFDPCKPMPVTFDSWADTVEPLSFQMLVKL